MSDTFRTTSNGWSYTKANGEVVNLFEAAPMDTPDMEMAEWESLNERQKEQVKAYTELATEFGMFDQTSMANGAHYAPADKNPFVAEGLKCGNCIFFNAENGQCQIVAGTIEENAVCKLWVIPEKLIGA